MKSLKISALAVFSALSLAACDGDGGTGVIGLPNGQFEGEISGVLDIPLNGEALSGYWSTSNYHDIIELIDYVRDVRVVIYDSEAEFTEGRWSIEPEDDFDSRIVAYVEDLQTGETFGSVNGTIDIDDARNSGIQGTAVLTAESDWELGDYITVDVVFNTDYDGRINLNLNPGPQTSKSPS